MRNRQVIVVAAVIAVAALLVGGQLLLTRKPPATPSSPAETTASTELTSQTGVPHLVPPLPGGTPLPAIRASEPAASGVRLHPLSSSPAQVVSGLTDGRVPAGSSYTIQFRPWGYGPIASNGQTVLITVVSVKAIGSAPSIASISKTPLLAVMYADKGGNVLVGGVQTATLVFLSDGRQVVPVLTAVGSAAP